MPATLDQPARIVDCTIGADHIIVDDSGDSQRIDDSQVLGVSSHLVTETTLDYDRPPPKRRYVDIEFLDRDNRSRIITVDEPDGIDAQMPEYIERVAVSAKDNTLVELLEHNAVTRKGFTITDQGMMVTAQGQPVWFALPDLAAFDLTPDAALVWQQDHALPIATITEEDPNAAVLALLIPALIQAGGSHVPVNANETSVRHMVGSVVCKGQTHEQTRYRMTTAAGLGVFLSVGGLVLNLLGLFPGLTGIAAIVLPIAGLLGIYFSRQSKTLLFVYRDGLSVVETRKSGDLSVSWRELGSSTIQLQRIEIPTTYRLPNHVFTEVQLKLRCADTASEKRRQILTWNLNDENALVTNYLIEKVNARTEAEEKEARGFVQAWN